VEHLVSRAETLQPDRLHDRDDAAGQHAGENRPQQENLRVRGPENDRRGKRERIDPSLSLDEKLSMLTDKYRTKV